MILGLGITTVWTFDQQRTKAFFTEKLGFEVRSEVSMEEAIQLFGEFRSHRLINRVTLSPRVERLVARDREDPGGNR